jgi:hypothetical protein
MPKKNPHRAAIARRLHESPRRPILASKKKTGGMSLCPPDDGAGAKEAAKSLPSGRHWRADRKTVVVTRAVRQGTTMTDSPFDIEIPDDAKVDVTYEITKGEDVIWMISIWTPGPEKRLVAKFVMTTQAIAKFMVFLSEMLDIEVEDALADWVALVVQTGDLRPLTRLIRRNLPSRLAQLAIDAIKKKSRPAHRVKKNETQERQLLIAVYIRDRLKKGVPLKEAKYQAHEQFEVSLRTVNRAWGKSIAASA